MPANAARPKTGFTLLELSIVLVIISLVIATTFAILTQDVRHAKQTELQIKLDAIQTALLNFRRLNNRLPCPADATLPPTDPTSGAANQYFGVESTNSTPLCANGSSYSNGNRTVAASPGPTVNFYDGAHTVGGAVPVKTLGLPDDYALDPWNGQFAYFVDNRVTDTNFFITSLPTDTNIGSMTVYDGSYYPAYDLTHGNPRTTKAIVVLLSYGPNGHGAFQANGNGSRKSSGSTDADEKQNCHCDVDASNNIVAQPFDFNFVQHSASSNNFDDTVRYYVRSEFYSPSETGTMPR